MKLEAKSRLQAAAKWEDDVTEGMNLWGNKALTKALNAVLKPMKSSVSMKRAELYIDLPEKDPEKVGNAVLDSKVFKKILADFNLVYDDDDFNGRIRNGDDFFIIHVKRKNPKKPVKAD
jgi:hypothetical protein